MELNLRVIPVNIYQLFSADSLQVRIAVYEEITGNIQLFKLGQRQQQYLGEYINFAKSLSPKVKDSKGLSSALLQVLNSNNKPGSFKNIMFLEQRDDGRVSDNLSLKDFKLTSDMFRWTIDQALRRAVHKFDKEAEDKSYNRKIREGMYERIVPYYDPAKLNPQNKEILQAMRTKASLNPAINKRAA